MFQHLYRGVNAEMHAAKNGELRPKAHGKPFKRMLHFGEGVTFGSGAGFGESAGNAVLMHQKDSAKYPSSGVSTTPNFKNAKIYATSGGKYPSGVVYEIDIARLAAHEVNAYYVDEHVTVPQVPGDNEVILVASDYGSLPNGIISNVFWV